jgi:hypothetical protein
MTNLFDDVLYGSGSSYVSEASLSYEEESYIENNITADPVSLSDYTTEAYIEMTRIFGALAVSEGFAAKQIASGVDRKVALESLADRAGDAYDTLKRWVTKIWKAIKKFAQKAWNRLKALYDRARAFFSNYESVLKNYSDNTMQIYDWVEMNINDTAKEINTNYDSQITSADTYTTANGGASGADERVVGVIVNKWRERLYGSGHTSPVHTKKNWNDIKGTVLQVTSNGYDRLYKDSLNWGEKDYKEAMSIHKEEISDRSDEFHDYDKDEAEKAGASATYYTDKGTKAKELVKARVKMHLRQRGIVLLQSACHAQFNQCVSAARKAIKAMHGVTKESYDVYSNTDFRSIGSMMI